MLVEKIDALAYRGGWWSGDNPGNLGPQHGLDENVAFIPLGGARRIGGGLGDLGHRGPEPLRRVVLEPDGAVVVANPFEIELTGRIDLHYGVGDGPGTTIPGHIGYQLARCC